MNRFALADVGSPELYATSSQVNGKVYSPQCQNSPAPSAVLSMESAYTSGQSQPADYTNYAASSFDGLTLQPGVYAYTGVANLPVGATLTLNGNCGDVFVFKSA